MKLKHLTTALLLTLAIPSLAGQSSQRHIKADHIEGQATNKNFVTNGGAEKNTRGWATYADAAGATPVNGTGGAANVTFTRSTASPLAGAASFVLTKDAANRQGEGASYDFTLEAADSTNSPQNVIIDFYYATGGTFATGASSDVQVFIYDVTNSTVINPEIQYIASSAGRFQTTFMPVDTSASYRLIFHVATTSASAWTLKLDRIAIHQLETTVAVSGASSAVVLDTGNGFGATDTNVRRYTNITTQGTAISCADSANDGTLCTIGQDGIYAMNRLDRNTGAASNFGISRNDDCSASGFNGVASADQLAYTMAASNVAVNASNPGVSLSAGDIIRACDDSGAKTNDTTSRTSRLAITKVRDAALPSAYIMATGGTITTDGNYRVHTFTSSGTFQITAGSGTVETLVVGGGGGGGSPNSIGGGGGAGRVIHTTPGSVYGTGSYTVTIGAGGTGGTNPGGNGGSSSFDSITAAGGGGGGGYNANGSATNGSGGGAGGDSDSALNTGGAAGLALSNAGGNNDAGGGVGQNPSAGGGGAGAAGGTVVVNTTAGNGGAGTSVSITGAAVTYGGGGGGSTLSGGTAGTGGAGGGGNGCRASTTTPTAGTANTGGGGGGGCVSSAGANGGSGVVIVRYQYQ
jgi:hypothetical protein